MTKRVFFRPHIAPTHPVGFEVGERRRVEYNIVYFFFRKISDLGEGTGCGFLLNHVHM